MSTGFFMFFSPLTRVPWSWAIVSFLLRGTGALLADLQTSRLESRDGVVYMQRSRWFLAILLMLLAIRLCCTTTSVT